MAEWPPVGKEGICRRPQARGLALAVEPRVFRPGKIRSTVGHTAASRSTVSGNFSTRRISSAAWAFGLARPCSQFSSADNAHRDTGARVASTLGGRPARA